MKKVFLVEDDKDLGMTLSENLQLEGYYVDWFTDGKKAEDKFGKDTYDIILLDLMLPNRSGYELLSSIRSKSNAPVIILSSKNQQEDKIKGLKLKADDYLTKPFHLEELFLRMKNLIERSHIHKNEGIVFYIGKHCVDLNQLQIMSENKITPLSETEAKALSYFYKRKNLFIHREELISYIWGMSTIANTRSIDNLILKFRKIIEEDPAKPNHFISKRGLGYCLIDQKEST